MKEGVHASAQHGGKYLGADSRRTYSPEAPRSHGGATRRQLLVLDPMCAARCRAEEDSAFFAHAVVGMVKDSDACETDLQK